MAEPTHDMDSRRQSPQSLRSGDHDHGLHHTTAQILAIQTPLRSVLRVTARLDGVAGWTEPNTAFRIQLDTPEGEASRIYTVRSVDLDAGSFDFDIVRHAHPSLMMQWAAARRPGDRFRITGPRPQGMIPPTNGKAIALFLDETAIPALYSMLPHLPPGARGIGWVATNDEMAFAELPRLPGLTLKRVLATHAGNVSSAPLVAQALALEHPNDYVVWGAGERDEMRLIRQHFRHLGLSKEQVAVSGYWKRGVSNTEIDQHRLQGYQRIMDNGGSLADYDDLAIGI